MSNKHAKPLKVIISNSKNDKKVVPIGSGGCVTPANTTSSSSSSSASSTSSSSPPAQAVASIITTATTPVNNLIDNDRLLRLFVVIPKDFRKKDLRDAFKVNYYLIHQFSKL